MGDLLLCSGPLAAVPFYVEGISINLYSLEELCYYIANNTWLMEKSFMSHELADWVGTEAGQPELAGRLIQLIDQNGKLSDFVREILEMTGYCTKREIRDILDILQELEEKSDFECNKIRADRLMEKEKYLSCIYEYKRLLELEEPEGGTPELLGDIWHNLGTAYARMFLFDEAAECFERAFGLNQNPESAKARLFACKCMQRDIDYMRIAREYGLDDTALAALQNDFALRYQGAESAALKNRLYDLEPLGRREYHQEIQKIIFSWKEDYRRISKI